LIFRKIPALFSFLLLFNSVCFGFEIGSIYHLKLEWKNEKRTSAYYKTTTYIFEAMRPERVLLYSEYGNLEEIHIWLPDKGSYGKLESVVSNIKGDIKDMIVTEAVLHTPLHKIFLAFDQQKMKPACEVRKTMEFDNADKAWEYILKMQDLIYRRGHLVFMQYVGKSPGNFDIIFSFSGDCSSKDEIVTDLLRVISITYLQE